MCGAVRYLATCYDEVVVVCKEKYLKNVEQIYSDDPTIVIYPIVDDYVLQPFQTAAKPNIESNLKMEVYTCGYHSANPRIYEFPLCFFSCNKLNTYININDFVVNKTILSYIRKPKTVSYYLDINCDLPEFTHNEILSMTASYLLEEFEAGRYKTHQETVITNE
jgi:hypothetical protein